MSFNVLYYGWMWFLLKYEVEAILILKGAWFMDSYFLSMNPWNPLFDAKNNFMMKTLV